MLIVANWKAYVDDLAKAKKLVTVSKRLAREHQSIIVIAPPAPLLGALAVRPSSVAFAAQDVSLSSGGAQTGEITVGAYKAAGAAYALIGHSERRAQGDTDAVVAQKLAHALTNGLTPILCVGERERDGEGRYLTFVREELTSALAPLTPKDRARVIVAYEPLWAIGKTSAFAIDPHDLTEMALYIRKVLTELLPGKSAASSLVLYGGSVDPDDARVLAASSGIDGLLVGHASTDPRLFSLLVKQLA